MKPNNRLLLNKATTLFTSSSIAVILFILLIVLGPMMYKGAKAVFFNGTIEFRKMQLALFNRGDHSQISSEEIIIQEARAFVYGRINSFKAGIDTDANISKVKKIYRDYGKYLRNKDLPRQEYKTKRDKAKKLRNLLIAAFESTDKTEIENCVSQVLSEENAGNAVTPFIKSYFNIAANYRNTISDINLQDRVKYKEEIKTVEEIIKKLFGPAPADPTPSLSMDRFGATRMDQVNQLIDELCWSQSWEKVDGNDYLTRVRIERKKTFKDTPIEPIFEYIAINKAKLFQPEKTFYWQYFIDDSTPGHYFGGIGPEILGTILITILGMIISIPLGIITAAFLAEYREDNLPVKALRICINTLAGVPSIVYGLFGLAFFVVYLQPKLSMPSKPCLLSAAVTLAILALPVIISASEQAIKSVPATYREASLGLGASRFQTFIKVTLPSALPGILTGVILSLSRIAGETAPILFTGAVALGPIPKSIFHPTRTLSYGSYDMAVGDRIATLVPHNQFGMVVTLIMLIILLNAFAIFLRTRISKKLSGH